VFVFIYGRRPDSLLRLREGWTRLKPSSRRQGRKAEPWDFTLQEEARPSAANAGEGKDTAVPPPAMLILFDRVKPHSLAPKATEMSLNWIRRSPHTPSIRIQAFGNVVVRQDSHSPVYRGATSCPSAECFALASLASGLLHLQRHRTAVPGPPSNRRHSHSCLLIRTLNESFDALRTMDRLQLPGISVSLVRASHALSDSQVFV
jgi:hypothetical protein